MKTPNKLAPGCNQGSGRSKPPTPPTPAQVAGFWNHPAIVAPSHFKHKSLCDWAYNTAIGCSHGCRFCYVPSVSANKQTPNLRMLGINHAGEDWGQYVLVRPWDVQKFMKSLRSAEDTPLDKLSPDGNRAILFCSTTDPYQVIVHADSSVQRELNIAHRELVRRALELILRHSSLRVRILTRSPLAKLDFDLFRKFGNRLLFGMSLPTLRNDLARIYEPSAPAPTQRLSTLKAAKAAGLNVYVAMAPTYPECDVDDLHATLKAIKDLDPVTIFHEAINVRSENVSRIEGHAKALGVSLNTQVFKDRTSWRQYALNALWSVRALAHDLGMAGCLHLWPDQSLGSKASLAESPTPQELLTELNRCWNRISEWPHKPSKRSS